MSKNYRPLTDVEIEQLRLQGCRAEHWSHVRVAESFTPEHLFQVSFFGDIRLGVFEKELDTNGREKRKAGIRNAELRNVTVGDNCLIENIGSYIANYEIGNDCYISQVGVMEVCTPTCFGNGTEIHVLQEVGEDITLTLHQGLTAQEAYIMVKNPGLNHQLWENVVQNEFVPENKGHIYDSVRICNVGEIYNACIYDGAKVTGALTLTEVTVNSSIDVPTYIGPGCIIRFSIIGLGAEVTDGVKIQRCFIGEATHIGAGFTATNSVFFANCYMDNGEACSVVAGPFTVSHHKSTLLIGCMLSFANLGSGTNMSNHMYKMGPVHYGIMDRGCKTASNAHLVWPARIGAFSMVMGKISKHVDATLFPFSYLFGKGDDVYLVPGINSMTLGTFRDMYKWNERDKRKGNLRADFILTDGWMNPAVMDRVRMGINLLLSLRQNQPDAEVYTYNNMLIERKALEKGLEYYQKVMSLFWGGYYVNGMHKFKTGEKELALYGEEPADFSMGWEDVLGFPVPSSVLSSVTSCLTDSRSASITVQKCGMSFCTEDFLAYLYLWQRSADGIPDDKVIEYARGYVDALSEQETAVLADLEKEMNLGCIPLTYAKEEKMRIMAYYEEKKAYAKTILSSLDEPYQE